MKKGNNNFLNILLLLLALFSFSVLTACGDKEKPSTDNPSSDNPTVTIVMTESYKTNRDNFKKVTKIELPALEKLEVDEFPYRDGDTSYCFDIIGGDNLNYQTYLIFENFFKEKIGNCDSGYPSGDETNGRDAQWTKNGRWYQTYWDKTNKAIYINTTLKESDDKKMSTSYSLARDQFKEITYLQLPIVYDVTANETNINAYVAGRKTYEISLESGSNLNYQTYLQFEKFFADNFTSVDGYPVGDEATGREAKWIFQKNELYTKYTTLGYIIIGVKPVETSTVPMTDSYAAAREEFHSFIGVLLPEYGGLEVEDYPYESGMSSYCFDMFEGENLSQDTFDNYKSFFDDLNGWTLTNHSANGNDTEYYDTYVYSSDTGTIELTLMKEGINGSVSGIFMNAFINTIS